MTSQSRVYYSIIDPDRCRRSRSAAGVRSSSPVHRVPIDIASELDSFIEYWEMACSRSDSPRYHFAKEMLSELKTIFPQPPPEPSQLPLF
jgi:hypothetical protein